VCVLTTGRERNPQLSCETEFGNALIYAGHVPTAQLISSLGQRPRINEFPAQPAL
jgi:hypothetical protein